MPRFFTVAVDEKKAVLTGPDAAHITKSLRMHAGEELIVCDCAGNDYLCTIESVGETVVAKVLQKQPCQSEPSLRLRLFQALPKGDKMEWITQKAVELGVSEIIPVLTERCISRPDGPSMRKKAARYQKIAEEAAKQSGRGIIPRFGELVTLQEAVDAMIQDQLAIVCYERGGKSLSELVDGQERTGSVLIGSEGGVAQE